MDTHEFSEFNSLYAKDRANFLESAGQILENKYDWDDHYWDDPGVKEYYRLEKETQNNGDDVEVEVVCRVGPDIVGDYVGYEVEDTDPDSYDAGDEIDELLDAFEEVEENFAGRPFVNP